VSKSILYARLLKPNKKFVKDQAAEAGISEAAFINMLLTRERTALEKKATK
jgi:hypothetical protein